MVKGGLPKDRIFMISNFVDTPHGPPSRENRMPRAHAGIPEHALVIIALARFVHKKGLDSLIHAFSSLKSEDKPLWLLILGDGELKEELQALAVRLGVADRICWAGWQTDTGPWFRLADLFVCPSREEPLGNVILEAWSHELPVISTKTDGAMELITDEENGILVDRERPDALSIAMQRLLSNEELRDSLSVSGKETLRRRHGREEILRSCQDLYNTIRKH